jgi:aspartate 1-decarboxylase
VKFSIRMQVHLLKSKIHRATVTDANLNYEGSMTISADLMEKSRLMAYERILVSNMANGNRFETYAIPGEWGTGAIILNGATSLLGKTGDVLTIMSYAVLDENEAKRWKPKVIVLGAGNKILNERGI